MSAMTTTPKQLDPQFIISKLLTELGEPWLPVHERALEAVKTGDAETLRLLSATNLDDSFCRACGYMASIPEAAADGCDIDCGECEGDRRCTKEKQYRLNSVAAELLG